MRKKVRSKSSDLLGSGDKTPLKLLTFNKLYFKLKIHSQSLHEQTLYEQISNEEGPKGLDISPLEGEGVKNLGALRHGDAVAFSILRVADLAGGEESHPFFPWLCQEVFSGCLGHDQIVLSMILRT